MSFYDKFCKLCKEKGVSPSKAAVEMGLTKGAVTVWKKRPDARPNAETLTKINNYFGVSTNFLLDIEKSAPENEGGRKVIMNPTEEELRRYLPTLTLEQKKALLALVKSILDNQKK